MCRCYTVRNWQYRTLDAFFLCTARSDAAFCFARTHTSHITKDVSVTSHPAPGWLRFNGEEAQPVALGTPKQILVDDDKQTMILSHV